MTNSFGFSYDDYNTQSGGDYEPIPPGFYDLIVDQSEDKPSAAGHGMLRLTLKVVGGDYDGRLVFENLNYGHPNEKASNIARSRMAAICRAVGKSLDTADEYLGQMFHAKVGVQPAKGDYAARNKIDKIMSNDGKEAAAASNQAGGASPSAPKKAW